MVSGTVEEVLYEGVCNHHLRGAQVWHVISRHHTVLPAHPHVQFATEMSHTGLFLPSHSWYSFTDPLQSMEG